MNKSIETAMPIDVTQQAWTLASQIESIAIDSLPNGVRAYSNKLCTGEHITNVPETALDYNNSIRVSELDNLPTGKYEHRSKYDHPDDPDTELSTRMIFAIGFDGLGDKIVYPMESAGNSNSNSAFVHFAMSDNQFGRVLRKVGIEVTGDTVSAFPTPLTLVKKAKDVGVDIELKDAGKIPPQEYLTAYSNGRYPVGLDDKDYYTHDIGDAHLPAVILGGIELRDALRQVASVALNSNSVNTMEDAAHNIDKYTALLAVFLGRGSAEFELSETELADWGVGVGITAETTQAIIKAARSRLNDLSPTSQNG